MTNQMERALAGALGGLVATVPMTALMVLWHRRLPWTAREVLPPAKITDAALQVVGLDAAIDDPSQTAITLASHLGYGTAAGALFGLLDHSRQTPPVGTAVAFGLGVWAGSYLGWLPATGLHRSALSEPLERNLLMVAAHIVWGASLGFALPPIRHKLSGRTRVENAK